MFTFDPFSKAPFFLVDPFSHSFLNHGSHFQFFRQNRNIRAGKPGLQKRCTCNCFSRKLLANICHILTNLTVRFVKIRRLSDKQTQRCRRSSSRPRGCSRSRRTASGGRTRRRMSERPSGPCRPQKRVANALPKKKTSESICRNFAEPF